MKEEVAALWKEVFNDSDEFVKLFFDRVYKPENTLVAKRDGQIVSALQMIPYKVKINDLILNAAYICGVCTRKSERGRGFMNRLMNEAKELAGERGFDFSFLIPAEPWLFDVYKRLGFVHEISRRRQTQKHICGCGEKNRLEVETVSITTYSENFFNYFNIKQMERTSAILHGERDFQTVIRDCEQDGGKVFTAMKNGKPAGMAFVKPAGKEKIMISEMFYDSDEVKERLIAFAGNHFFACEVVIRTPFDCETECYEDSEYGLAYVHNEKTPDISKLFTTLMMD